MLIESVSGLVKNVTPPVQAEFAVARGPVSTSREGPKEEKRPDFSDIADRVADTQRNLNIMHDKNLNFSVHQASGHIMVTVTDETTGEVIREIPSSELLNLAAKLDEMVGILFDEKG
jgi:uncharacterized FlaG/YvyC family protein